jgi:hypothetical protein
MRQEVSFQDRESIFNDQKQKEPITRWSNDGPSEKVNSFSVLVEWLTTGDNYSNYRGGRANDDNSLESQGKSKMQFCKDIGDLIIKAGCETKSVDGIKKD